MSNEDVRNQWAERFGRPDPKIVCVGLNYSDHTGESGMEAPKAPLLFGKFSNTLCGDGDPIFLRPGVGHVDAEAELAVVIGERASRVPEASATEVIAAYTCSNDVSARDAQFGDGQWFRGKGIRRVLPDRAEAGGRAATSIRPTCASSSASTARRSRTPGLET